MSRATVVVVSYNSASTIASCIGSVASTAPGTRVLLVDNASSDSTLARVSEAFPSVEVIANGSNVGYARANNQGLARVTTPYVLFLNPDCLVEGEALARMIEALDARPRVGAVGPRTLNPDRTSQVSFGADLRPLAEWRQRARVVRAKRRDAGTLRNLDAETSVESTPDWVSGSCLMARTGVMRAAGGFDENFFLYEEDADLCRRVRQRGFDVLFLPAAVVVHSLGHSAAGMPRDAEAAYHASHLRYYAKYNGFILTAALRAWLLVTALRHGFGGLFNAERDRLRLAAKIASTAVRRAP